MTTQTTVGELTEAASVAEADYLLVVAGGVTKKLSIAHLFQGRNFIELNKNANTLPPSSGTVRYCDTPLPVGSNTYTDGYINRVRGYGADGVTPRDIGFDFAYTRRVPLNGGTVQTIQGFGDWDNNAAKAPDYFFQNFNSGWDCAFNTLTPTGDVTGIGLAAYPVTPVHDAWPWRRIFVIQRFNNLCLFGTRDHLVDPEEALGHGLGVMYHGWAEIFPTTAPTQGVIVACKTSDSSLYIVKPNGNIFSLDSGGITTPVDLVLTGNVTLSSTQAELPQIFCTGSPASACTILGPSTKGREYRLSNRSTQNVVFKRADAGGTGVTIAPNASAHFWFDGTDYVRFT